jgi:serine/threonine protein kinase
MGAPAGSDRIVAGRYRLIEPLGSGGMGTVWLAEDELLRRPVAAKEIFPPAGMTADERTELRQRTLREARTAARLSHPNVVTIYDVAEDHGRPWIIMELIQARSLRDLLEQDGPLDPPAAARVGLQVLAALRSAHALGIMHRDVKPGNVLIEADGRAVLADFGIARAEDSTAVTATGVLVGSPSYIAPERAQGDRGGPASDLWSLGATLYAAVEGRPPYERSGALATLMAVVSDPPDPPRRAGAMWPVISGLLAADQARRLGADEAEQLLRRAAEPGHVPVTAPMPVPDPPATVQMAAAAGQPPADSLQRADRTRAFPTPSAPAAEPEPALAQPPVSSQPAGSSELAGLLQPAEPREPQQEPAASVPSRAQADGDEFDQDQADRARADADEADQDQAVTPRAGLAVRGDPLPDGAGPPAAGPPVARAPDPAPARESVPQPAPSSAAAPEPEPGPEPTDEAAPEPVSRPDQADEPARTPRPVGGHELADEPEPPEPETADEPALAAASLDGPEPTDEHQPASWSEPETADGPAPAWRAAGRRRPARRRSQVVAAIAAVAAVAVAGTVLGLHLADGPASKASASSRASHSAAAPPSSASAASTSPRPRSSSPTAKVAARPAFGTAAPVPSGYHRYQDPTGFSIAMPDGWNVSHQGGYVYLTPPSGGAFLLIDQSDHPLPDPLANWQQQEANRRSTYPGYRRVRLVAIDYPQAEKAADWEFTYYKGGVLTHVLNRNVLANARHAYALYWSTPEADWASELPVFTVLARTFQPAA